MLKFWVEVYFFVVFFFYSNVTVGDLEIRWPYQGGKKKTNFASPLSSIIAKSDRSQNGTIFAHDVCTFPQVISEWKSKFHTNILYLLRVRLKAGL